MTRILLAVAFLAMFLAPASAQTVPMSPPQAVVELDLTVEAEFPGMRPPAYTDADGNYWLLRDRLFHDGVLVERFEVYEPPEGDEPLGKFEPVLSGFYFSVGDQAHRPPVTGVVRSLGTWVDHGNLYVAFVEYDPMLSEPGVFEGEARLLPVLPVLATAEVPRLDGSGTAVTPAQ